MFVLIDDREVDRISPASKYFRELEHKVLVTELLYGDYVFVDEESKQKVAFEYKSVEDYISSLTDYRVFNQALNQSNEFDWHFVIIVGTDEERKEAIKEKGRYSGRYVSNEQFYGSFASLVEVTSIIQTPNQEIAFMTMEKIASKCLRDRPVVKRFQKSRGTPAFRLLVNNVNRVGYITAERICEKLDLETVEDVLKLTVEKLTEVDGVGQKTARSIMSQLKKEFY